MAQSVPPGDIQTQPNAKIVFNAPHEVVPIKMTNSSTRRIGFGIKTTNTKTVIVLPPCGVLDPKETVTLYVFYAETKDTNNDRIAIEWTNTPDGAVKQFRREWFQGDGMVRRKNLPIEYKDVLSEPEMEGPGSTDILQQFGLCEKNIGEILEKLAQQGTIIIEGKDSSSVGYQITGWYSNNKLDKYEEDLKSIKKFVAALKEEYKDTVTFGNRILGYSESMLNRYLNRNDTKYVIHGALIAKMRAFHMHSIEERTMLVKSGKYNEKSFGMPSDKLDHIIGTVIQECKTSDIAREAAISAGVPDKIPAHTVTLASISSNVAITQGMGMLATGNANAISEDIQLYNSDSDDTLLGIPSVPSDLSFDYN